MKAGWITKPLGELCDVIGGGTPPKDRPDYYGGEIPWATVRDMRTDIITSTEHSITKEAVKASATNIIPAGNVVIATRVGLGKVCLLGQDTGVNQDLRGIVPKSNKVIDVNFLFAWLKSISEQIIAEGTGATVQGVKLPFIKGLAVPFPEMEEQRRIVTLLDEAFADIATAKANAEKNLQNARELFDSHLDASFGQRNESWTEKALQDIGSTQTGSTPKTSDQANYGKLLPFIKPGDFAPDGTLDYENDGLSAQGADSARKVSANSVLMVCIGATIGKCGYADREIATNQQINAFTPEAGIDKKFIYYQMLTKRFQDRVIHGSGQATLPIINKSKWSALTVFLPATLEEQEAIAEKLDAIREKTQRLEVIYRQKLTALDDLKKSLLYQAFSGQL